MRGTMRVKFKCPSCNGYIKAQVIDTSVESDGFKRYRKCEKCGIVFVTMENICYMTKRKGREVNAG